MNNSNKYLLTSFVISIFSNFFLGAMEQQSDDGIYNEIEMTDAHSPTTRSEASSNSVINLPGSLYAQTANEEWIYNTGIHKGQRVRKASILCKLKKRQREQDDEQKALGEKRRETIDSSSNDDVNLDESQHSVSSSFTPSVSDSPSTNSSQNFWNDFAQDDQSKLTSQTSTSVSDSTSSRSSTANDFMASLTTLASVHRDLNVGVKVTEDHVRSLESLRKEFDVTKSVFKDKESQNLSVVSDFVDSIEKTKTKLNTTMSDLVGIGKNLVEADSDLKTFFKTSEATSEQLEHLDASLKKLQSSLNRFSTQKVPILKDKKVDSNSTNNVVQYCELDYKKALEGKKNLLGAFLAGADLSGKNLAGVNLNYANLRNAKLNKANLKGATFCGANLSGAHLEDADLEDANFSSISEINKTDLTGAFLNRAKLINTKLEGVNLNGADLSCESLRDNFENGVINIENLAALDNVTSFVKATLEGADLTNANFSGVVFLKTNFKKATAENSNFNGACFYRISNTREMVINFSNFTRAVLQDIDFDQVRFIGSVFNEARINDVTFKTCEFKNKFSVIFFKNNHKNTQINDAELVDVTFDATDLTGINFEGSVLTRLKIKNTSICNASFKNAKLNTCLFIGRVKKEHENPNWVERATQAVTKFLLGLSCNLSIIDSIISSTNFKDSKIKDTLFRNNIFTMSSLAAIKTIEDVVFDNCFLEKTEVNFLMQQGAKVNGNCSLAYQHRWGNEPSLAEKFSKDLVDFSTQKAAALVVGFFI